MKRFTIWVFYIIMMFLSVRVYNTFEPYVGIAMAFLFSLGMFNLIKNNYNFKTKKEDEKTK